MLHIHGVRQIASVYREQYMSPQKAPAPEAGASLYGEGTCIVTTCGLADWYWGYGAELPPLPGDHQPDGEPDLRVCRDCGEAVNRNLRPAKVRFDLTTGCLVVGVHPQATA